MKDNQEERRVRHGLSSALIILVGTGFVLRSMGREWWCNCGSLVPWSWDIWSSHNSQHLIDPYSFTHVLHGVIFFLVLKWMLPSMPAERRFLIALLVESAWEVLENSPLIIERYRAATISLDYYGDSIANSISDIVACAVGYVITNWIGWRWAIAMIFIVELVLLLTIRDCLTLNVIMLLHPFDAVKEWQMGAAS